MPNRNEQVRILDDDELYRRIAPPWLDFYRKNGRFSSAAFKPPKGHNLSVNIARLTSQEITLRDNPDHGLASLITRFVRSIDLNVIHTPTDSNQAHADIIGTITKTIARQLAGVATIVID